MLLIKIKKLIKIFRIYLRRRKKTRKLKLKEFLIKI